MIWVRRSLVLVLLLALLTIVSATLWFFNGKTPPKLVVEYLNTLPDIQLNFASGTFSDGVQIDYFRWQGNSLDIEAENVWIDLSLDCFLTKELCISDTHFGRLQFNFYGGEASSEEVDLPDIFEPFTLSIERGIVDELVFHSESNTERLTDLSLNASWDEGVISFPKIEGTYLGVQVKGEGSFSMINGWNLDTKGALLLQRDSFGQFIKYRFEEDIKLPFQLYGEGIHYKANIVLPQAMAGSVKADVDFSNRKLPYQLSVNATSQWTIPEKLIQTIFPGSDLSAINSGSNDVALDSISWALSGELSELSFASRLELKSSLWPIKSIDTRGEYSNGLFSFENVEVSFEDGAVLADGDLSIESNLSGNFDVNITNLDFENTPLLQPLAINSDFKILFEVFPDSTRFDLQLQSGLVNYQDKAMGLAGNFVASYLNNEDKVAFEADLKPAYKTYSKVSLLAKGTWLDQTLSLNELTFLKESSENEGLRIEEGQFGIERQPLFVGDAEVVFSDSIRWKASINADDADLSTPFIQEIANLIPKHLKPHDKIRTFTGLHLNGGISAIGDEESVSVSVKGMTATLKEPSEKDLPLPQPSPYYMDGGIHWTFGKYIDVDEVAVRWRQSALRLHGRMDWFENDQSNELKVIANNIDLENWLPDVQGKLYGEASIAGQIYKSQEMVPSIAGDLRLHSFAYKDVSARKIKLLFEAPEFAVSPSRMLLEGDGLIVSNKPISKLLLRADGTRYSQQIKTEVFLSEAARLSLRCGGKLAGSNWDVDCSEVDIFRDQDHWGLDQPLSIKVNEQFSAQVAPVCFVDKQLNQRNSKDLVEGDTTRICLKDQSVFSNEIIDARMTLDAFPVDWLARYWPALSQVTGQFDAEFVFNQVMDEPFSANLTISTSELALSDKAFFQEEVSLEEQHIHLQGVSFVAAVENQNVSVRSQFDIENSGRFALDLDLNDFGGEENLSGKLLLSDYKLSSLESFIPELKQIAGTLDSSVDIAGTLDEPTLNGSWRLFNGMFAAEKLSEPVTDIHLSGVFEDKQMEFGGIFSTSSGGANMVGDMRWKDYWRLDADFQSNLLTLLPMRGVKIDFRPDIQVSMKKGQVNITGNVDIPSGSIEFLELPANAKSVSSDARIVREGDDKVEKWEVNTDVAVNLGDNVHFKGVGIQTYVKGGLKLNQNKDILNATGELLSDEGELVFLGQRLDIAEGRMIFNGPLHDPDVFIDAVREIEDDNVTAGVRLSGKLDEPKLEVYSVPSLEETIALHYLMTGHKPVQGETYGTSIAGNLLLDRVGVGNRWFSDKVVGKLGVTDFQISTQTQEKGTSVQLSGYLSPDLYLQYGVKLFSEVNSLSLRYRLKSNLFLEAMTGLETSLDVIYSFEVK